MSLVGEEVVVSPAEHSEMHAWRRVLRWLLAVGLLALAGNAAAGDDTTEVLRSHLAGWLATLDTEIPIKSSTYLKGWVVDQWELQQDSYRIVSLRSEDAYHRRGHIPHAINIPLQHLVEPSQLQRLDDMQTTVVYDDDGYAAVTGMVLLNLLGYPAISLKFGMMDWNVAALEGTPWDRAADWPVTTARVKAETGHALPALNLVPGDASSLVRQRAARVVGDPMLMSSEEVHRLLSDWDRQSAAYQVVSVRTARDYRLGHLPHAINIPLTQLLDRESLARLDPGKTIIVYCYTGHTGQIAVTLLRLMGYRAYNMRFGMMDWNRRVTGDLKNWDGRADYAVSPAGKAIACCEP